MRAKTETGIWVFEEGEVRRTSVRRLNGKGEGNQSLWDFLQCGDLRPLGHPPGWRYQGLWDILQMSTPVAVDSLATHQSQTPETLLAGYKFSWEMGTWKESTGFQIKVDLGFSFSLSLDGEGHLTVQSLWLSCSVHILTKIHWVGQKGLFGDLMEKPEQNFGQSKICKT